MLCNEEMKRFYKNRNVLIPGGAGFIGSNLAKSLVRLGANVTIVDSFDKLCGANSFNLNEIESRVILAKKSIESFLVNNRIKRYSIIFNCVGLTNHYIGQSDIRTDYRINCASSLALLEELAINKAKIRMISIGSRSQYGRACPRRVDESHPMNPLDIQSTHKLISEHYHRLFATNYCLDLIYVRLTNVYGPCQRLEGGGIGAIGEMIRDAITGNEIVVFGSLFRIKDILFIDDVIDALLLLGMKDRDSFLVYNVGGNPHTLKELVSAFKNKLNLKVRIRPFPDKIKKIDTGDVVLKTGAIKDSVGWIPRTDIDEGVNITLDYYERNKRRYMGHAAPARYKMETEV